MTLADFEMRRRQYDISMAEIERMAGVASRYLYKCLKGHKQPSPAMIMRLNHALSRIRRGERQADERMPSACYRLACAHVALFYGVSSEVILSADPAKRATADKDWMLAAALRRRALYVANIMLGVPQAELARAAGMTKAAVSIALNDVEDERDNPEVNRLFAQVEEALAL